jgi:acetyltransferase-like isoleucine patch superfamily enzyme
MRYIYSRCKEILFFFYLRFCKALSLLLFFINDVKHYKFTAVGLPLLDIHPHGRFQIGNGFSMVNKAKFATLGKSNRCKFVVGDGGQLIIGDKVGMSNTTIVATSSVTIGNNILIGGGCTIVDTDFHSLNPEYWHTKDDLHHMLKKNVVIKNNVFIGMESVILKGVVIGNNVIIAAGSVVTKSIPDNEIWGGNPAQFLKKNIIN